MGRCCLTLLSSCAEDISKPSVAKQRVTFCSGIISISHSKTLIFVSAGVCLFFFSNQSCTGPTRTHYTPHGRPRSAGLQQKPSADFNEPLLIRIKKEIKNIVLIAPRYLSEVVKPNTWRVDQHLPGDSSSESLRRLQGDDWLAATMNESPPMGIQLARSKQRVKASEDFFFRLIFIFHCV